jgi:hypothetical protein
VLRGIWDRTKTKGLLERVGTEKRAESTEGFERKHQNTLDVAIGRACVPAKKWESGR